MKPIDKKELYQHVGQFLKGKGIELTEGSYSKGIQATCSLLADAINLSQAGIEKAKTGLDKKLDQVRQVIHEKTAPKPPRMSKPQTVATSVNSKPSSVSPVINGLGKRTGAKSKRGKRSGRGKKT